MKTLRIIELVCLGMAFVSSDALCSQKLVIWEDLGKSQAITKAANEFCRLNDCEVVFKEIDPNDQVADLAKMSVKDTDYPDVFVLISDKLGNAVKRELISPIDYLKGEVERYECNAIGAFSIGSDIYAAPRSVETQLVFYNADLIEYPCESLEEYIKLSKHMKTVDKYGLIGKFDEFFYANGFVNGYGGYLFGIKEDGSLDTSDIGMLKDASLQGLTEMITYARECVPACVYDDPTTDTMDDLFIRGKVAAIISGPWSLEKYADSGINFGVAPLPKLSNGNLMNPYYGVKGYALTKNSKHPELAKKFIAFINKDEYAIDRYFLGSELPPIRSVLEKSFISSDDMANTILSEVRSAKLMPNDDRMQDVWLCMNNALKETLENNADIKTAVDDAVYYLTSR
ncbi:MAG: extracellular solute-binding protein [Succinivibrio sp.]